jgi:carbonic anhydrase/acetyltransferase-like protein (isoleucine patch superfamily)
MPIYRLGDAVPKIHASAFVHPAAHVIGAVEIGEESSVWPGAVLRGDYGEITIGARTSIQDNAVIHTTTERFTFVGNECTIGHHAFLEACVVEDSVLVAVGACVLPGAAVRAHATVAAGAVVLPGMEVPSGMRAQGVPAKIVVPPRGDSFGIARSAAAYREMARRYKSELVEITGD